ncbi:MAG: hypothetical protein NTW28_08195 [Candidatus Solibacter sp.]|nr:hypothetical protein [Candidatus Solibacter sp.]
MSTIRQIEANRRNSQKSTGPTSVTGKAVSSMNALKTGIHAKSLVLPSEKLADLEQLIDEYYQRHHPTSPEARALLDDLIHGEWLKRRLRIAETQLWAYDHKNTYTADDKLPLGQTAASRGKAFAQLQWRIECTRRSSERALQDLRQLQAEAEAAPPDPDPPAPAAEGPSLPPSPQTTSPEIGFVPEPPPYTPPQPASQAHPTEHADRPHLLK